MAEPSQDHDGEVLRKRMAGRTFAAISRELDLGRPTAAQEAFRRAFRRLPATERADVSDREGARLDRMADQVRSDAEGSDDDKKRRLDAIERLRLLSTDEAEPATGPS